MSTALDTNIIVALWDPDDSLNSVVQSALDSAFRRGSLVISAPVIAELMACPGRSEAFLNSFIKDTGVFVDWDLGESVWRVAGRAFQVHAARRREQSGSVPRRILADFLIGAHALENGFSLLTLDDRLYQSAFPNLRILRP